MCNLGLGLSFVLAQYTGSPKVQTTDTCQEESVPAAAQNRNGEHSSTKAKQKLGMEGKGCSSEVENSRETSRLKTGCLWFAVSVREVFRYAKATILGQARYFTARNEEEAAKAEMLAAKMQVEAADEAENAKKKIQNS